MLNFALCLLWGIYTVLCIVRRKRRVFLVFIKNRAANGQWAGQICPMGEKQESICFEQLLKTFPLHMFDQSLHFSLQLSPMNL